MQKKKKKKKKTFLRKNYSLFFFVGVSVITFLQSIGIILHSSTDCLKVHLAILMCMKNKLHDPLIL